MKTKKDSPLIIFAFAFDPSTQRANWSGNISPEQAVNLLQQIAIANAVRMARNNDNTKKSNGAP